MKRIRYFLLSLSLFFILSVAMNMSRFGYGLSDGFWRTLMSPFEETIWAKAFSEGNFGKVKLQMDEGSVINLVGEPLTKNCSEDNCFWIYSTQATGTADYDQRTVIFSLSGRVIEIRKAFFID